MLINFVVIAVFLTGLLAQKTLPPTPVSVSNNLGDCPVSILNGAAEDCEMLRRAIQRADATLGRFALQYKLTWDTSKDCLMHTTLCNVSHPSWGAELEQTSYDFSTLCKGHTEISMHYHYRVNVSQMQYNTNLLIPSGDTDYVSMLHVRDSEGVSQGEQLLSIDAYERNANGQIIHQGWDDAARVALKLGSTDLYSPRTSGGVQGTWVMIHVMYKYDASTFDSMTYELHLTHDMVLSGCPKSSTMNPPPSHGPIIIIGVLSAVVVLVTIIACLIRKYYVNKAQQVNTTQIHVVPASEMRVVTASQFVPGQEDVIVQGTVLHPSPA
jgi:hypothetical protein